MKHFLETSNALNALVLNLLDHLDTTQKGCLHGSTAGVSSNFQWSNWWFGRIRLIFQDQFVISARGSLLSCVCVSLPHPSFHPPCAPVVVPSPKHWIVPKRTGMVSLESWMANCNGFWRIHLRQWKQPSTIDEWKKSSDFVISINWSDFTKADAYWNMVK